jgi:non-ribosomal peptide synthetase component F
MVRAGSVGHFIQRVQDRFPLTPEDRFLSSCELSFDGSIFDMLYTWNAGAALHIVPPDQALAPARQLREATVCHFVPSVMAFMKAIRALQPGAFPHLRRCFFGGEAVCSNWLREWREAAPAAVIESIYGPTEATVFCMAQPFLDQETEMMPLGRPLGGTEAAVVDADFNFLGAGQEGELALSGPQLAAGYLNDEALTAARFPILEGRRWYLTGDRAVRDEAGVFHFRGRLDRQVKILGNRVELEEVESALRAASGSDWVAVVLSEGTLTGMVGFVVGEESAELRHRLQQLLPSYAVPSRIIFREALPVNANGKIDRAALTASLADPQ